MTSSAQAIRENFSAKVAFELSLEEVEVCELSKLDGWVSGPKEEHCEGLRRLVCLGNPEPSGLAGIRGAGNWKEGRA